jgi:hypothetical protein
MAPSPLHQPRQKKAEKTMSKEIDGLSKEHKKALIDWAAARHSAKTKADLAAARKMWDDLPMSVHNAHYDLLTTLSADIEYQAKLRGSAPHVHMIPLMYLAYLSPEDIQRVLNSAR